MGSMKKLSYARRKFTDADLDALPVKEEGTYPYEEVDFSQNSLSVEGLRKVLSLCGRCDKMRVLKLFKNDIDDNGAKELAKFLRSCTSLEELHLSHNHFTVVGVEAIVAAAEQARTEGQNPLWCRVEMNDVSNPEKVVSAMTKKQSVCARHDNKRCTVTTCVNNCKVHLPHFGYQRGSKGKGKGRSHEEEWWEEDNSWAKGGGKGGKHRDYDDDRDYAPPPRQLRAKPAAEEHLPPRPKGQVQIAGGIFLRAMGNALSVTKRSRDDGPDDGGGDAPEGRAEAPPAKKQAKAPKANVASATFARLGLVAGKRQKAKLTAAKKGQVLGSDASQDEDEPVSEQEAASDEALSEPEAQESGSEAAAPQEPVRRPPPRRVPTPEPRRRSPPPVSNDRRVHRVPPRREQSPPRRGDRPRAGAPDRYVAPPRDGRDAPRGGRDAPRRDARDGHRDDRGGGQRGNDARRGRMDDRSRSRRPVRNAGGRDAPRGDGRGAGRGRPADRDSGTDRRPPVRRQQSKVSPSASPPPRRAAEKDARPAAARPKRVAAARTAAKPAKAAGADDACSYSYTEETDYTDVSEGEGAGPAARKA